MINSDENKKETLKTWKDKIKRAQDFILKYFSFRRKFAQRMYIFILTLGLVIAILTYNYSPDIGIELGNPSPRTIKANKAIEFEERAESIRSKTE